MRALLLTVTILCSSARADDDGSSLIAAGYSATAFSALQVAAGIALFGAGAAYGRQGLNFFAMPGGVLLGSGASTALGFALPALLRGYDKRKHFRRPSVTLAPGADGVMVGVSGSF